MAGCFNDTCSVVVTQTTGGSGGAYEVNVQLSPSRGIFCYPDEGLGANLVNETAAPVGNDILRYSPDGQLHASMPNAIIQPFTNAGNSPVLPAVGSGNPVQTATQTFTNSSGFGMTVIAQGTWSLTYAVLSPDSPYTDTNVIRTGYVVTDGAGPAPTPPPNIVVPYNAMWGVRVLSDIGIPPTTPGRSNRFSTSGTQATFDPAGFQIMRERRTFVLARSVPAGASWNIAGDIFHDGINQTMNVVASGSGDLSGLGFAVDEGSFVAFPVAS